MAKRLEIVAQWSREDIARLIEEDAKRRGLTLQDADRVEFVLDYRRFDSARVVREQEAEAPGPVNCNMVKRREGKAYPRTCERCGLGPCPFYHVDGKAKT